MAVVAFVWFFYLIICPAITLSVVLSVSVACQRPIQVLRRGVPAVLFLALILGPMTTEVGFMPWWAILVDPEPRRSAEQFNFYIWTYMAICAGAILLLGFASVAIRSAIKQFRAGPQ